ncbi:MAG: isoprenylcysteine carboxylmethyltransferase family protein [Acidobacteriota bacterium]
MPSFARTASAIVALPALAVVVAPALALAFGRWDLPSSGAGGIARVVAAIVFGAVGVALFASTVALFFREGEGTLAPWDPPRRFVARGPYRHVRNPMITGVLCTILSEAIAFGSMPLVVWAALFFAANALWIPFVEEPALSTRFGSSYEDFRRNVPRWIPRRTPFRPPDPPQGENG